MSIKDILPNAHSLNARGYAHFLMPMVVIVAVAAIGTYVISMAHAATVGTTYYVSSTGSDDNNGLSQSSPWKTISHVNTQRFKAGDTILFKRGDTFNGQLYFSSSEIGTATNPITVSSYGSGVATINGGTSNAIYALNTAGLKITHLKLIGSGASTNTGAGLNFYNDLTSGAHLNYVYISSVSASGFKNGMALGSKNAGNGYNNVTVTSSTFDNNLLAGLATYGPSFTASDPSYGNDNVAVSAVTAYDNLGDSTFTGSNDSGNGIVLGSVSGGTISTSSAYNNGADCTASACGVGIWTYDSNKVTIQHNISYDNHTGSNTDGDGFDLDQNTSNSTVQYNYSYNNDGAGILLFGASGDQSHTSNTVRFNISQDDGQKNTEAGIVLYGNVNKDAIYNNTVYVSAAKSGGNPADIRIFSVGSQGGNTVRNNLLYAAGIQRPVVVTASASTSALNFQANDYYPNFGFYWGTTNYTSLASLRSATGQEKYGNKATGSTSNPRLASAGNGTPLKSPSNLNQLTQYKLLSGSPMKNAGLNLTSLYGVNMGGNDFFGEPVPTSAGVSIGAAE